MFTHEPWVVPINEHQYILKDFCVYESELFGVSIVVPTGFVTDLASIPRVVWTLIGWTPDGLHRNAAIVHDFIYQRRGRVPAIYISPARFFSRKECDQVFKEAMLSLGVSKIKANIMYGAVRTFGWLAW